MMSVQLLGRAKNRKSAAHAKPKGTRQRCIHVPPLANRNQTLRRKIRSALQTIRDRVKHSFHVYVHADPFVARAPVTVLATRDIVSLDADVITVRTAVSPPFCWSKQAHDGYTHSNSKMRGAGLAAYINFRAFYQRAKAFQ